MEITEAYPRIPFQETDRKREAELLKLAKAFGAEMRRQGNPYALKGGTALRFTLGLPRPSVDLDFEGEKAIWLRLTVRRATRNAFPNERFRVGWDLTRVGTIAIRPPPNRSDQTGIGIDYRETSSLKDAPTRIPSEKCRVHEGITVYDGQELVHRKLQTLIGPEPREKARDIYDAGWLVNERPELIRADDRRKLRRWLDSKTPRGIEQLQNELRRDPITGQVNADTVWTKLEQGIEQLDRSRTYSNSRH